MTGLNPDPAAPPAREFYDRPTPAATDPADDLPLTVRVQGGDDWRTRLFDPDALRAVRAATSSNCAWTLLACPAGRDDWALGDVLTHDQVRDWAVVPAYATSTPWAPLANRAPAVVQPTELFGDMDVEAFRG